jgi:release factor glutamine methyltransferase
MIMTEMTYKACYEKGYQELMDAKIVDAKNDARILLEIVCNTKRHDLFAHPDRIVIPACVAQYFSYISIRKTHKPLQYIVGKQEFMGLEFLVNEHVLIPRQDTETLVEEALKHIHDGMKILDVATGSGCVLISLLNYTNSCEGIGVDIDQSALEVAKENATRLKSSAVFLKSDLFEQVEGIFDVIVSNPPYIKTKVLPSLMPEVLDYEPLLALDGKEDGLFFYRKIIKESKKYMHKESYLLFEIGFDQAKEVSTLLEEEGFIEIKVTKDYAGLDRVVSAMVPWETNSMWNWE